ncbi:Elongation factor 1-beta [Lachnellula occidentalis]|uniref:Elongation factor 1-beta n=1 Tax=Lachnellula occidentalis TaxID=215460 RepID=A0A8H8UIK9_9HELO|nr:Elongation factor 1-beta [Lachnellula occidentalis]
MGFLDILTDAGLTVLNSWLETRSYIVGYSPSQADVATFKGLKEAPDAAKYPYAARWYKHIASYTEEFATLEGDASKAYTTYGPEESAVTLNPAKAPAAEEEDDEVDLFGSSDEEEDAEAEKIRNERLAEYKKKKEGKTKPAAKSVVTMDVKPWDDETDMKALEEAVRGIHKDGLVWGLSKLVAVGYGIKKLQINLVIEDDKVGTTDLEEEIAEFEDFVQSVDIVSAKHKQHYPPATNFCAGCYAKVVGHYGFSAFPTYFLCASFDTIILLVIGSPLMKRTRVNAASRGDDQDLQSIAIDMK